MTTPLPPDVRTLFRAPFQTDKQQVESEGHVYPLSVPIFVHDADGDMAASLTRINARRPVPRGYGRHQYLFNGDARHDAWCEWFTANVPERATLEDVARILNEAWAGESVEVDDATP